MILACIGSRTAPEDILAKMYALGRWFASQGILVRSGGANGSDKAFVKGVDAGNGPKEIYTAEMPLESWWFACAEHFHPNWPACAEYAKKLHARNTPIVLGPSDVQWNPSNAVVCWTKNGSEYGGTGQGLRIAKYYQIPIFNLFDLTAEHRLWAFLQDQGQTQAL